MWRFCGILTSRRIEHRRPDIVVVNKKESTCDTIDVVVPGDKRVNLKEIEKIENYSELRREVKKIWQLKEVRVIPIVIGSLGTISNKFENGLEKLNLKSSIELMQKTALLGTAKIIRKVLENWGCWVWLALKNVTEITLGNFRWNLIKPR